MSSARHEARVERWYDAIRLGVHWLVVGLGASGCFGDWVSARPRPDYDEPVASAKVDLGIPADACTSYLAAVAERCDAVLEGSLGHCHRELLRVMALWREADASARLDPRASAAAGGSVVAGDGRAGSPAAIVDPRAESREGACAQELRALPDAPRRAAGAELGPECQAWARALRQRCVAPLSSIPPDLRGCGADLLAFESTLGAITFGRPQGHERTCRDAAQRLSARP